MVTTAGIKKKNKKQMEIKDAQMFLPFREMRVFVEQMSCL